MAVSPGGEAVAGADRVTVTGLAVDLASGMAIDGVVAGQDHGLVGGDKGQDQAGQTAGQLQGRPLGGGENSLVGGAVPVTEGPGGSEQVGDGSATGAEDGRAEEGDEAIKSRGREDGGKSDEQRLGFSG